MIVREFNKVGVSSFLAIKSEGISAIFRKIFEIDVFNAILIQNQAALSLVRGNYNRSERPDRICSRFLDIQ